MTEVSNKYALSTPPRPPLPFYWNTQTVSEKGYKEVSTMLYELGVVEADLELLETEDDGDSKADWPMWPLKIAADGSVVLELHDLTQSTAL